MSSRSQIERYRARERAIYLGLAVAMVCTFLMVAMVVRHPQAFRAWRVPIILCSVLLSFGFSLYNAVKRSNR